MEGSCLIGRLPEECLSHVLSLSSPRDACRSAAVSPAFRTAADSDAVWRRFLPPDLREIASRAVDPMGYASLKELYFRLCDSVLVDGGKMIFALERESGAKCYTLCARNLEISWGDDQRYWIWDSHPDSRFAEVAELRHVCWLDIRGKINCRELSSNTAYKAYLIFRLSPDACGLKFPTQLVSVSLGTQISEQKVCLDPYEGEDFGWDLDEDHDIGYDIPADVQIPHIRSDAWMELEMGEFFNEDGDDGEVSMSYREVKILHSKEGLIVEGILVRPA